MGSYNSSGFLSRIPILSGDRVVCFLGKKDSSGGLELGSPFALVSPIYLPFYGKYNNYGYIKEVDETLITKIFEKYVGVSVEKFTEGVDRCIYGDSIKENIDYWKKSSEVYQPLLSIYNQHSLPVLLMEHEDFYNNLFSGPVEFSFSYKDNPMSAYDEFYKLVEKTQELYKFVGFGCFVSPPSIWSGINNPALLDLLPKKKKLHELAKEIETLSNPAFPRYSPGPKAFQVLDDVFEVEDTMELFLNERDEVRKIFNFIYYMISIPMNIGFSKICGEQNYDLSLLKKMKEEELKMTEQMINKWEE